MSGQMTSHVVEYYEHLDWNEIGLWRKGWFRRWTTKCSPCSKPSQTSHHQKLYPNSSQTYLLPKKQQTSHFVSCPRIILFEAPVFPIGIATCYDPRYALLNPWRARKKTKGCTDHRFGQLSMCFSVTIVLKRGAKRIQCRNLSTKAIYPVACRNVAWAAWVRRGD